MTTTTYGSKYDRTRDVATIAKCIRTDIRGGVKAGDLPKGLKVSVKIQRYSGGQSIALTVKAAPGVAIMSATVARRYTVAMDALLEQLRGIVEAYNFDGSDIQSDYFHVCFYSRIEVCSDLRAAAIEALRRSTLPRVHLTADCAQVAS